MKIVFCLVINCISFNLFGQAKTLILVKGNTIVARYQEGERVRFQRKNTRQFSSGVITGIQRDFFKLGDNDTVFIRLVGKIDLRHHSNTNFHTASSGQKLIAAGLVLLLADRFSSSSGNVSDGVVVTSAVFLGTGTILQFLNNNYFKIGRRKKLTVGNQ